MLNMMAEIRKELFHLILENSPGDIKLKSISQDKDLIDDFSYDSISLIQLVVSIEEKFNIEFESEFLASDNITSINSILNYILNYSK